MEKTIKSLLIQTNNHRCNLEHALPVRLKRPFLILQFSPGSFCLLNQEWRMWEKLCMAVMTDGRIRGIDSWRRMTLASHIPILKCNNNRSRLSALSGSSVPLMTALQKMICTDAGECVRVMCFSFFSLFFCLVCTQEQKETEHRAC